jgi:hypothetical protein
MTSTPGGIVGGRRPQSATRAIPAIIMLFLLLGVGAMASLSAIAAPNGAEILSWQSENATPQPAASITTYGGSFTTLLLNATTQTMRWKAYVGNVTGSFTLSDASNFTIYDWTGINPAGEVYASRNNSIAWSSIRCINTTLLGTEQDQLNITTTKEDSINRTFNQTVHRSFYVGTTLIANSTCRAIATYVNSTRQAASENASFQEVLLDDTQRTVYATILEQDRQGYNNAPFDFQMIVAESEYAANPSPYYFWVELS